MIRDIIVCDINHPTMNKHLLSKANITFASTLEFAQGLKSADQSSKSMQRTRNGAQTTSHGTESSLKNNEIKSK